MAKQRRIIEDPNSFQPGRYPKPFIKMDTMQVALISFRQAFLRHFSEEDDHTLTQLDILCATDTVSAVNNDGSREVTGVGM